MVGTVRCARSPQHTTNVVEFYYPEEIALFERDFVEGVDTHLDAIGDHAGAVWLDPNTDVVIDDAFDGDQNAFHREKDSAASSEEPAILQAQRAGVKPTLWIDKLLQVADQGGIVRFAPT